IRAGDDPELQAEERGEFALPIADQARGRDDENALHQTARPHLTDVEARHDGLARTGVIGQQEPQRELLEHVFVNGDALVRQRIDLRYLRGERWIEHVAEAKPLTFGKRPNDLGRTREI